MNYWLLVCTLLVAILSVVETTIDTTNLNLQKYQFFKHPRYREQISLPPLSPFEKTRAVWSYVRKLLFGYPGQRESQQWIFDPEVSVERRKAFEKQFGHRGENLIALIGRGYSRKELIYYGAINKDFENF